MVPFRDSNSKYNFFLDPGVVKSYFNFFVLRRRLNIEFTSFSHFRTFDLFHKIIVARLSRHVEH